MTLTQPSKSSREWERKHDANIAQLQAFAKQRGVRVRKTIHSPAFEAAARADLRSKLAEAGE